MRTVTGIVRRRAELERPVEGVADLVHYFRVAEKPRPEWRVGTEHEKFGLHRQDLRPVAYEGPGGIRELLEAIAERDGWQRFYEGSHLVALEKEGSGSITLEPGCQVELSGVPLRSTFETCDEFHRHLGLVREVSEPRGLVWLGLGMQPFCGVEEMPRVPKQRYAIMREYLPRRGELALEMMHCTATVQANFDYADEADMVAKMRTALSVTSIVSAIFANSSLSRGKPNGFVSRRMHVWTRTDPDRTGLLPFAFDEDFGYEAYARWALSVPMFFIYRDGVYRPAAGMTFREFVERGFEGERPTLMDFDLHLTTLFPEVRLKGFIEVRGADAVPPGLTCAVPALWKGLLYDRTAAEEARELVRGWDARTREEAHHAVAREGLRARVGGRPMLELARDLVGIADRGLARISEGGERDERRFLDPVREQLELGKSPGEVVLESFEGAWGRSPRRLIEYARY